jgi:hypothetical protein
MLARMLDRSGVQARRRRERMQAMHFPALPHGASLTHNNNRNRTATLPHLQLKHLFVTLASDLVYGWELFRFDENKEMVLTAAAPLGVQRESAEFTACAAAQVRAICGHNLSVTCGYHLPPHSDSDSHSHFRRQRLILRRLLIACSSA